MQVNIFNIDDYLNSNELVDYAFSFRVFIEDLKQRIDNGKTFKAEFYRFILARLEKNEAIQKTLSVEEAMQHVDALELIYTVLSPPIADETEFYWGIGTPIPGSVLYGTDAYKEFTESYLKDKDAIVYQGGNHFTSRLKNYVYRLVLQKLYHISFDANNDTLYTDASAANGLERYYQIHLDTTYVEIIAKSKLPELKPELIEQFLHQGAGCEVFEELMPLEMFRIEGFSVITVEEITIEQSINNIRLALVNDAQDQNELYEKVTHALQTLTGNSDIEFGLLPFLRVNGNLVYDTKECFSSVLVKSSIQQSIAEETYNALVTQYMKNPRAIFFNEINDYNVESHFYLKALKQAGIVSYAILPVYYNRKLAGVMEIYSKKAAIPFEKLISKLEAAVPLLSQLLHNSAERFNNRIETVIKDKFTTLQNSVEWKFNEAAWNYIKSRHNNENRIIDTVGFKDVYPLYGAIDIRNSTNERNLALKNDLTYLLNKLIETLRQTDGLNKDAPHVKLITQCNDWISKLEKQVSDNDETSIKTFLQAKVYPTFDYLKENFEQTGPIIKAYFDEADENKGEGFLYRRNLEQSITLINTALNNYFEKAQYDLQEIYPCYFEKFRTDGVEYDIFTGQALAPEKPFDEAMLQLFRKWQLSSMIDIVRITSKLTGIMKCVLQTTQLIFIHSGQIDICFRKDERRFDVEGAYNIRYEVVKKRIDKVHIKDTDERLTQPGKIALVYSTESEADYFLESIREFQSKGLLAKEIERYDLEELQGVTGLKAIRLSVIT
ncbi:GAF domain-containing protein [Mucilaginibacter sp. KACC 22063]|uniref:GAF domain-containing protein n=1 Tax=Mucilaginibacter sp. KACC 22063 TaxID=3025666 RepID=UPI00236649D2|nr:GAF domain-containing protein [Mucilaginibacter sp. KACC 22063]WDF56197.1 GAF domain-containing protein [Mucilaginibacter sp. KACC 22063]